MTYLDLLRDIATKSARNFPDTPIDDPVVIEKILTHLVAKAARPEAP